MCTALTIQGRLSRGFQGYPQFLANQLTLFQPRGAYHSHHISNGTSKFFDLPLCLQSTYQHSVIPLLVFLDDTLVSASWWSFFLSRIFLFLTFPACFSIPIIFSNLNSYCSNLSYLRNLQGQVKKAFCYQKLFWPFTVRINCSSDLKYFANSQPSASNFKIFLDH